MTSLIIDTDIALGVIHEDRPRDVDDGFAIVHALNSSRLELRAVTTVFGNAPLDAVDRAARELLACKGADVPILSGAGQALPQAGPMPPPNDAVRAIASFVRQERCHIAAIGPLTNLGLLVHHFPDVLANVASVVAIAGRTAGNPFYLGERGPVRDFNFENDVRAARLLLESGVSLVLAGFELTSQVVITEDDLNGLGRSNSPIARHVHERSLAWCRYWTGQFPADAGFHPWDSAAISWLEHPEFFASERRGWRIRRNAEANVEWLETGTDIDGPPVTYCTGFTEGSSTRFTGEVIAGIY